MHTDTTNTAGTREAERPSVRPEPELLGTTAAARLLGVRPESIRSWTRCGWLPHEDLDGWRAYRPADLEPLRAIPARLIGRVLRAKAKRAAREREAQS
jgi:DNA-binding transcriptional MerR regulator